MLYEMLAGSRPFKNGSPAQIMRQVEEADPPPLPKVPRDLAVITFKALAKNPAKRYSSARELYDDLQRWLRAEPILARPPRLSQRILAWHPSLPALAALSGFLVLSIIAAWGLLAAAQNPILTTRLSPSRPTMVAAKTTLAMSDMQALSPLGHLRDPASATQESTQNNTLSAMHRRNNQHLTRLQKSSSHSPFFELNAQGVLAQRSNAGNMNQNAIVHD
jgi:serine/threonine protein kinase